MPTSAGNARRPSRPDRLPQGEQGPVLRPLHDGVHVHRHGKLLPIQRRRQWRDGQPGRGDVHLHDDGDRPSQRLYDIGRRRLHQGHFIDVPL